jgi:fatty-acyl-CoA synthase/feruloyl-CoA synthase
VALADGATLTLEELREHCRPLIADYKLPHDLVIAAIPRNASGKILKHRLRAEVVAPA